MPVVSKQQWEVTVPVGRGSRYAATLPADIRTVGGTIVIKEGILLATTLRKLGLPDGLNNQLVRLGITTTSQLRKKTERALRRRGLSWQSIVKINLCLEAASPNRGLKGRQVAPSDGIEHLDIGPTLYGLLREKGISQISQLLAMDAIAILGLDRGRRELLEVLWRSGRKQAPLGPNRPLSELLASRWTPKELAYQGLDPTIRIRDLSATAIRASFSRSGASDGVAAYWVGAKLPEG
jgi:hypothetical protein